MYAKVRHGRPGEYNVPSEQHFVGSSQQLVGDAMARARDKIVNPGQICQGGGFD